MSADGHFGDGARFLNRESISPIKYGPVTTTSIKMLQYNVKNIFGDIERDKRVAIVELAAWLWRFYIPTMTVYSHPVPLVSFPLFLSFFLFLIFFNQPQFSSTGISPLLVRRLPRASESARDNQVNRWNKIHTFIRKAILSLKCRRAPRLPWTRAGTLLRWTPGIHSK